MKLAIFEIEEWEHEAFEPLNRAHEVIFVPGRLTADTAAKYADIEMISTFVHSELNHTTLKSLPNLKLIATRSTGFDHIDTAYCCEHGITVCNVPSYGDNTVAEHVFGLLLTISHHLREAFDRTREGNFSTEGLRGFDLREKTLGVIGTGQIGRCVIGIAKGFRMRVVAFDLAPDHEAARQLGFDYMDLNSLLKESDVVTLHVPANDSTRHLLSTEQFQLIKKGAVLINTARGTVVDTRALLWALANGRIAAAGLDVLPEEQTLRDEAELLRCYFRREKNLETLLADHLLMRSRNVHITPHNAYNTQEAIRRILKTTVHNIRSFAVCQPQNLVVLNDNGHRALSQQGYKAAV
jgi:D-lactate dehydrogenase